MKQVHEVYTTVDTKCVVKFSSEDISEAQEFMNDYNTQHPDDQCRILSLYTYTKLEYNATNQKSTTDSADEVHGVS